MLVEIQSKQIEAFYILILLHGDVLSHAMKSDGLKNFRVEDFSFH